MSVDQDIYLSARFIYINLIITRLVDPALARIDQPGGHTDAGLSHHAHIAVIALENERHLTVNVGPYRG